MKVKPVEPEGFVEFWNEWRPVMRHTDGKGLARDAYRKQILNGAEPQDILDGATWFIRNLKERDREFVPLSQTWLNRECYADLCEMERTFQAKVQANKERADNTVVQMRDHPRREIQVTPEAKQLAEQLKARHAPNR